MEDSSITGRAYSILRSDIISCRLSPGVRLNISQLQKKLTLSQAAVREALSRLAAEGLVEIERNRGFRVSQVSTTGFRKLTEALMAIELPCLRAAIVNGDLEWELNLIAAYHRALRTLELVVEGKEELNSYANERLAFYEALLAAADNPWLLWSWRLLYTQNARYRQIYMSLAKFELDLNPHHEQILKAVLARDVDRVVALSVENYEKVSQFIEEQIHEASPPKPQAPAATARQPNASIKPKRTPRRPARAIQTD
ncbi:GntR family transcriptional regulator [Sphingobium baderi]|jgi:DNA-binding GntR family transcriptional regulator|uniref:HTH gntR-type domain-containing protein n=1 Tax=Sphingobium baderi TaxID=1332080 RepID=A0A0S3EVB9_9SPHN|nr:GntR family transcriptional regulator [Sphingobium baderi]ALR19330.1 hypothetical protein ATN00_02425 [Sphingobium baderi]